MQTEPKRKRRWFQFSLRSLLIGVTLLALPLAYVGWQVRIVREPKEMLDGVVLNNCAFQLYGMRFSVLARTDFPDPPIPWIRKALGDVWVSWIVVGREVTEDDFERIWAAFPEANVARLEH